MIEKLTVDSTMTQWKTIKAREKIYKGEIPNPKIVLNQKIIIYFQKSKRDVS